MDPIQAFFPTLAESHYGVGMTKKSSSSIDFVHIQNTDNVVVDNFSPFEKI